MNKLKNSMEWINQAGYDMETGQALLTAGRYIYCVFMCHLALEKALKAMYVTHYNKNAPKVHSLVYLAQSVKLQTTVEIRDFLENLDEISVPVRYPEELDVLLKGFSKEKTEEIFGKTKEALAWLTRELKKQ